MAAMRITAVFQFQIYPCPTIVTCHNDKAESSAPRRESMVRRNRHIAKTGEMCEIAGKYESECIHRERKLIRTGETFPACHRCRRVVFWRLLKPGV